MRKSRIAVAALGAGLLLAAAGCGSTGSGSASGGGTLTLYNGQHESTTTMLVADFTKATGIKVKIRSGDGPELAHQILTEGSASPADAFFTENSTSLMLLSERGKFAKTEPGVRNNVPA
ncbi:MAG: substrate-binding domain-containing protein, partial [Sciscionella sp.]